MSAVPVNSVEQTIVLGGVVAVDLVREGKQPGHMALHADPRRKTPSLHVCTGTDLGTRQGIKMGFEIVAERAREPWPLAIHQHTQHDLPRPGGRDTSFGMANGQSEGFERKFDELDQLHCGGSLHLVNSRKRQVIRVSGVGPAQLPAHVAQVHIECVHCEIREHRTGGRTLWQVSLWQTPIRQLAGLGGRMRFSFEGKSGADARQLEAEQRRIAQSAKDEIDLPLGNRLEKAPHIDLHQPSCPGMLQGRLDEVTLLRKSEARIVRRHAIQDMLSNPALRLHEAQFRNGDCPKLPCGCIEPSPLLQSECPVGFDFTEDDVLKEFRGNVAEVADVMECQNNGEIGIGFLDVARNYDRGFDGLFRSTSGLGAGTKLLRIPRVQHLL